MDGRQRRYVSVADEILLEWTGLAGRRGEEKGEFIVQRLDGRLVCSRALNDLNLRMFLCGGRLGVELRGGRRGGGKEEPFGCLSAGRF